MSFKDVCEAVPFAKLNPLTCILSLNTTGVLPGWYAVAIQLEDFQDVTSNTPMSSVNRNNKFKKSEKWNNEFF